MSFNVTWSFKEVLNAINPNNPLTSAQQLSQFIGVPSRPRSLRRLIHRSLAWRVQHQHLIQHVFVLMLENRSFDHIFGYTEFHGGTDTTTDEQTEVDGLLDQVGQNFNPLTNQPVNTTATADF